MSVSQDHEQPITAVTSGQSHTPGPWTCEWHRMESGAPFASVSAQDGDVCYLTLRPSEVPANARLIAAAPELLEVLAELLTHSISHYGHPADEGYGVGLIHAKARAAIAKAEGRQ